MIKWSTKNVQVLLEKSLKQWPEFTERGLLVYCPEDIDLCSRGLIPISLRLSIKYPAGMVAKFQLLPEYGGVLWYSDTLLESADCPITLYFFNVRCTELKLKDKPIGYIVFTETAHYEHTISYI